MNCYLRTFDPAGDPTYKISFADWLIRWKSDETHSEFQLSSRYGGISVSVTMEDGCKCVRFKWIDYTKHPLRWLSQIIPLTDEQEDAIFAEACKLADISTNVMLATCESSYMYSGYCYHGPNARKYDLVGVVLCNLSKWRIIRSNKKWYWCSELVCHLIQVAYPDFNGHADTQRPDTLYNEWEIYRKAA